MTPAFRLKTLLQKRIQFFANHIIASNFHALRSIEAKRCIAQLASTGKGFSSIFLSFLKEPI
jgi:hypothetical protein